MTPEQFYQKLKEAARLACRLLDCPESQAPVFLGWWDLESGRESPSWIGRFNYAGITHGGPPNWRVYESAEEFVRDHVDVLLTQGRGTTYRAVVEALRAGRPPAVCAREIGLSPWDAGHYLPPGGEAGDKLIARISPYVGMWASEEADPYTLEKQQAREWAQRVGITRDGSRPGEPATREEVWVMLHRALKN